MTEKYIRTLRDRIGADPILTDEEIEFVWKALGRQTAERPIKGSINPDKTQQYSCPNCGRLWWEWNFVTEYCGSCGQRIDLSDRGFANTMDEIMAHIGTDTSTKSDFTSSIERRFIL